METALIIVHLIIALVLIVIVLLQQGKQAGLSGAVAGGAETFFGKNKGRTVDAMLKKVTSVVAILFIISSLTLAYVATRPEETKEQQKIEVTGEENKEDAKDDASKADETKEEPKDDAKDAE